MHARDAIDMRKSEVTVKRCKKKSTVRGTYRKLIWDRPAKVLVVMLVMSLLLRNLHGINKSNVKRDA